MDRTHLVLSLTSVTPSVDSDPNFHSRPSNADLSLDSFRNIYPLARISVTRRGSHTPARRRQSTTIALTNVNMALH